MTTDDRQLHETLEQAGAQRQAADAEQGGEPQRDDRREQGMARDRFRLGSLFAVARRAVRLGQDRLPLFPMRCRSSGVQLGLRLFA